MFPQGASCPCRDAACVVFVYLCIQRCAMADRMTGTPAGRMSLTSSHRTEGMSSKFDGLVLGGGNGALCGAISAGRAGASVLVPEGAPKFYRGGNPRHTRNM